MVGSDYHAESIDLARARAGEAGVSDRVAFEVASAQGFTGTYYDLVMTFDALHDLGDPVGAARQVREAIAPDGTWLVVEPNASEKLEENLNPVGRLFYAGSIIPVRPQQSFPGRRLCAGCPSRRGCDPLDRCQGGFTRFRRAAETPFNAVYEIRP